MRRYLFLLPFVACLPLSIDSQDLVLRPGFRHVNLVDKEVLEDKSRAITIDEVLERGPGLAFRRTSQVNFGFQHNPFWLRAPVLNLSDDHEFVLILELGVCDRIDVYLADPSGRIAQSYHHDSLDRAKNLQTDRVLWFPVTIRKDIPYILYARMENRANINFPIEIRSYPSFAEWQSSSYLFYGFLFGFLVVILLYNLFLYFTVRERSYGYYVIYLMASLVFSLFFTGMAYPLFFKDSAYFYFRNYQRILGLSYFLYTVGALLFSWKFLGLKSVVVKAAMYAYTLFFGIMVCLLYAGLASVQFFYSVLNITSIALICFLVSLGAIGVMRGSRPAIWYTIARSFPAVGIIITILETIGKIPFSFLTVNAYLIGTAFEVVLLSLALGDSINAFRSDKERAQRELIEQQRASLEYQTLLAGAFARFVPRQFLQFLNRESIADVRLGDQVQRTMTVLFSDIRSFTSLSELMTPRENFDFVNAYLGRVSPVIQRHGGFIDKYIGDGIMALFSSRPAAAVLSAIGMHEAVRSFNLQRIAEGESPIEIGIGIHCGSLMLGTVGDEARMDTTVISDVVNSASRLEGLNKLYGTRIIVSEDVRKEIQPEDGVELRCLDLVRVKGRTGAVRIYEVLNVWEADRRRLLAETGALFESAGEMYRSGKIGESMAILHRVLELDGRDAAAELYIKRCAEILEKGLPPGWDGVTVLFRK